MLLQEYIPLIGTLCNPGLRERHWKQMSEIAETDITPDTGTTLRKVLKLELEPFLEKFDVISGAATKVTYLWLYTLARHTVCCCCFGWVFQMYGFQFLMTYITSVCGLSKPMVYMLVISSTTCMCKCVAYVYI